MKLSYALKLMFKIKFDNINDEKYFYDLIDKFFVLNNSKSKLLKLHLVNLEKEKIRLAQLHNTLQNKIKNFEDANENYKLEINKLKKLLEEWKNEWER